MRLLFNLLSVWLVAMACGGVWSAMEITGSESVNYAHYQ
jgi:hypothetical protein